MGVPTETRSTRVNPARPSSGDQTHATMSAHVAVGPSSRATRSMSSRTPALNSLQAVDASWAPIACAYAVTTDAGSSARELPPACVARTHARAASSATGTSRIRRTVVDVRRLVDGLLELACERPRVPLVAGDDEARVVPGQRPDDLRVVEPVERAGDRRRRPELRLEDDDVLRDTRLAAELVEDGTEGVLGRRAPPPLRRHVAGPPELVVHLLEPQLANIPRHRRLRHVAARSCERLHELELGADALAHHRARDQLLAIRLRERLRLHGHGRSIDIRGDFLQSRNV